MECKQMHGVSNKFTDWDSFLIF